MSYKVTISCEREGCNAEAQVPQVGALPTGWVGVTQVRSQLNVNTMQQSNMQAVTEVYCSDTCAHKVLTEQLQSKAKVEPKATKKKDTSKPRDLAAAFLKGD